MLAKLLRRGAQRFATVGRHALADVRSLGSLYQLGVEFRDNFRRRCSRRKPAVPTRDFITRHAGFADGGNFRGRFYAPRTGDRKPAHTTRPRVRQSRQYVCHGQLHLPRHQIDQRLPGALVRHVRHLDAGHAVHQFHRQMHIAALPRRAVIEFARLRFRQRNQITQGLHRQRRMHYDQKRRLIDQ